MRVPALAVWALIGALFSVGVLGAFSIGAPLFLGSLILATWLMIREPSMMEAGLCAAALAGGVTFLSIDLIAGMGVAVLAPLGLIVCLAGVFGLWASSRKRANFS
jgi:hypothetical protein